MAARTGIPQHVLSSYRKLALRKYRRHAGKFMVEGARLVGEAVSSGWDVEAVLAGETFLAKHAGSPVLREARKRNIAVASLPDREIGKLSDTVTAQGILAVVRARNFPPAELWDGAPRRCVAVALEDVADPGNVGTILRTCDWFGVHSVVLAGITVEPYNPKVTRGSMGAIFHLPVAVCPGIAPAVEHARKRGFAVTVTVAEGGTAPREARWKGRVLVVFGSEARGASPALLSLADQLVTIPGSGRAESLNVAVSCGIVLSSIREAAG